jgi:hypothetical protein
LLFIPSIPKSNEWRSHKGTGHQHKSKRTLKNNYNETDANGPERIKDILAQLLIQIKDTIILAGREAYTHSLLFYNNAKLAAKNNVPGAKEIYDDLKVRFPGNGRRKSQAEK